MIIPAFPLTGYCADKSRWYSRLLNNVVLNCMGPHVCEFFSMHIAPIFSFYRSLGMREKFCVWLEITIHRIKTRVLWLDSIHTVSASCPWVNHLSVCFWGRDSTIQTFNYGRWWRGGWHSEPPKPSHCSKVNCIRKVLQKCKE